MKDLVMDCLRAGLLVVAIIAGAIASAPGVQVWAAIVVGPSAMLFVITGGGRSWGPE